MPLIVGFAILIQTLNSTIVFNALPAMGKSFDVDPLRLNLSITLYMLSAGAFLPITGWMADRFGSRRIFLSATMLYAVASVACGLSQTLGQVIASRMLQGGAAAAMLPVGRLILLKTTPRDRLVGAMAMMTLPASLGPLIGPALGGAIVTFASWRWIFLMNLPIGLIGGYFVWRYVPEVKEKAVRPVDLRGSVLTGFGMCALIFACEALSRRGGSPAVAPALIAVGVGSLALYAWHARTAKDPVIDLGIFRRRTYSAAVLGGMFFRLGVGAMPFLLAMLLQVGFGWSAFKSGMILAFAGAAAMLMRTLAPPILRAWGFRTVLIVNGILVLATFLASAAIGPSWPTWLTISLLVLVGLIQALQQTALSGLAFAEIATERMSAAATGAAMIQQFAQSAGIGIAATVLQLLALANHNATSSAHVRIAFVLLGVITALSLRWFALLQRGAGAEMSGHRPVDGR